MLYSLCVNVCYRWESSFFYNCLNCCKWTTTEKIPSQNGKTSNQILINYLKCDYDQSKTAQHHQQQQKQLHVETDHVIIEYKYSWISVILIKICEAMLLLFWWMCNQCNGNDDGGEGCNGDELKFRCINLYLLTTSKLIYAYILKINLYYLLSSNQNTLAHYDIIALLGILCYCFCFRSIRVFSM